jgi:hypothetical protein
LVWALVLVTRGTARRIIILIASYYFYMCWSTRYFQLSAGGSAAMCLGTMR